MSKIDLLNDGVCRYKVLIPQNASERVTFAANEFLNLFRKATGVTLETVCEFVGNDNYFSIGDTALLAENGVFIDKKTLTDSGYMLFSLDKNVFMAGGADYGTIYSVYGFFEKFFDYRYFCENNIAIDEKRNLSVEEFSYTVIPSVQNRTLGYCSETWQQDTPYMHRLKVSKNWATDWVMQGHTYFKILPKEKYFVSHPEWYSEDGKNLCLTNLEMRDEFIKNLKVILSDAKNKKYAMIGQEDNFTFCNCEKCRNEALKYGGNSAVMMRFSNAVAEEIEKDFPDITLVTFAYNATFEAPAVYSEALQEYTPAHISVKARKNLAVMLVCYYATTVYSHPMLDEKYNSPMRKALLSWHAVSDRLCLWEYNVNFTYYLYPFPNWRTMAENYRDYNRLGVEYLFIEANHETGSSYFHDLKIYVQTRLMYDCTLDYNALIDDFMRHYYKDAYADLRYYLDLTVNRFDYLERKYNLFLKSVHYLDEREYWSLEYLDDCLNAISRAYKSIEKYKNSDAGLYADLHDKILRESLSPRYIKLNLYSDIYGAEKQSVVNEFKKDCEKFGIDRFGQGNRQNIIREDVEKGLRERFNDKGEIV